MFGVKMNLIDDTIEIQYGDEETNYIYFPKDQWKEFVKAVIQVDESRISQIKIKAIKQAKEKFANT